MVLVDWISRILWWSSAIIFQWRLSNFEYSENKWNLYEIALISHYSGLETLTKLKELHLVHNKLTVIEGLHTVDEEIYATRSWNELQLTELEYLELGDNRIRKIGGLENNIKLKRLFLGANQIRKIEGRHKFPSIEHFFFMKWSDFSRNEMLFL